MMMDHIKFTGVIARADQRFPVEFMAWAGDDSRLQIEIDPLPPQVLFALQGAMGEPGSFSEALVLEGVGAGGETLFSDSVVVRGVSFGTDGNILKVAARKVKVVVVSSESLSTPLMRLWFRGFKSFRNPIVKNSLGLVEVRGNAMANCVDDVSGYVTIKSEFGVSFERWVDKADKFLTFMHRGLSFAHGSRLQTPRLDLLIGDRWETTYYEGDGFGPGLPPIHHLNQGPFIDALAKRFDDPEPFPDIIWTAVGWLHSDNPFDEGRFLMSMTALETIVEHVTPKSLTTVIPKEVFKFVRDSLVEVLSVSSLNDTSREIFEGKLKALNGRTLAQKIQALRDYYGLSSAVFTDEAIVKIIKTRNAIVHTGHSAGRREIWPKIMFIREFISSIIFRAIRYNGPYQSYIDGYKTVYPEIEH